MSNFSKSIVYSGFVLAAGLVAIFTIYNNMPVQASDISTIEPAAGQEEASAGAIVQIAVADLEPAAGHAAKEEMADAVEEAHIAIEEAEEAIDEAHQMIEDAAAEAEATIEEAEEHIEHVEEAAHSDHDHHGDHGHHH